MSPYARIPYSYLSQLHARANEGRVRHGLQPLGILHDSTPTTGLEDCRNRMATPILGEAQPMGKAKVKELPTMTIAVFNHKGLAGKYAESYTKLSDLIAQNGYQSVGLAVETCNANPKAIGSEMTLHAHIQATTGAK